MSIEQEPAAVVDAVAPDCSGERRWRSWRWPLLAVVVVTHLAWVYVSPVPTTPESFYADLAAGDVRSVQVGTFDTEPPVGYELSLGSDETPRTSLAGVRWVGRFGTVHQSDLRNGLPPEWTLPIDSTDLDVPATVAATARAAGQPVPPVTPEGGALVESLIPFAAILSWLLVVAALRHGPQPRRFTKWGWSWVILLLPAGTGAVWYLLRDAPWSERMSRIPALPPGRTRGRPDIRTGPFRRGGWFGLLVGVAAGQLLAAALAAGHHALLDQHAAARGPWHLVDQQGNTEIVTETGRPG